MKFQKMVLMLLLCALLSACGAEDQQVITDNETTLLVENTEAPVTDVRYAIKEELPEKDYGGAPIRILMRNSTSPDWIGDMFSEEETGEVISDAVYNRNLAVSERFDVTFELIRSSHHNYETDGIAAILAGEDAYDIIVPHARAAFIYSEQNLCLDWNSELPYVDLDKPWWDQDARESFEINKKLFPMVGDLSYQALAQTDCVLFNKAIFDDFGEEYPYQKVIENKWTFDEFSRLVRLCSEDVNGDGAYKPEEDVFGYATYQWVGPIQALTQGGARIVDKDVSGKVFLSIYIETTVEVYEKYFDLLYSDNSYLELSRNGSIKTFDSRQLFAEGRAMFIDCALNDVSFMRDMKDDFGIIPAPKFDSSFDRYYTNVDSGTNLFIVPITVGDAEKVSIILEALAAEGYREVIPAYYEVALQNKYARDDLSVQMLDIIKEGRVFDLGYYYCGGTLGSTGKHLAAPENKNKSFTTFYAENETVVKAALDKINKEYGTDK